MRRERSKRAGAFTLVEMMTVVLIVAILMALLLFGIASVRRAAAKTQCLGRIQQLGLGFSQYATAQNCLPSVHTNIWAIVGFYVAQPFNATSDLAFANNDNSTIGKIYRCPADTLLRAGPQGCSYAPNCEDAPDTQATGPGGADERNWRYSPWSNFKLDASMNPVTSAAGLLRTRSLSDSAQDTILLIESWNRDNMIDVTHYQRTPMAPLSNYHGSGASATLNNAADAGAYAMLEGFGARAASGAGGASVRNNVFHGGQVCILFADLHAAAVDAITITQRSPANIPAWTRALD